MIIYVKKDTEDLLPTGLEQYEAKIGYMTPDERKELREWVAAGNLTICNPWYMAGEDGRPLDYINASRTIDDMVRNPEDYGIGLDQVVRDDGWEDDDMPF